MTHITRRKFASTMAGAASLAAWARRVSAAEPARLTFSAPLTHSDWMLKPGVAAGLDGVKHMLDACQACGWSHVYWRVFDAGQSTYASKLLRPASHPEDDNFFNPQTDEDREVFRRFFPNITRERAAEILAQLDKTDYGQFDSLAAAIEYGHSIGLKIHAWATINEDDHGWGWASEFSKAHPEFRWVRRDGSPYRSQMSFAFPEVRQYKLDLIRELLAYDIDGLFLDWIRTGDVRDNPQTDAGGVADSGYEAPNIAAFRERYDVDPQSIANDDDRWVRVRAEPQTLYMREVRKLVESHERRKLPMAVMVGHPWHYRGLQDPIDGNLRGLLLDVRTWAAEGLMDAAVAAGYYRAGGSAENAYRALEQETLGKVDLWYYAWVPQSVDEFNGQFAAAQSHGAERILFWEADYIDDRSESASLKAAMSATAK
jgi:uncharacterized lipoprotein YddW (UPF0748 family)